jgi:hypothetical protein
MLNTYVPHGYVERLIVQGAARERRWRSIRVPSLAAARAGVSPGLIQVAANSISQHALERKEQK